MTTAEAFQFLNRLASSNYTQEELNDFLHYLQTADDQAVEAVLLRYQEALNQHAGYPALTSAIFIEKLQAMQPAETHKPAAIRRIWYKAAAAAVLVMIAGGALYYYYAGQRQPHELAQQTNSTNSRNVTVPPGERKSIRLPDGSQVILNGGSTLSLPNDFNKSKRTVQLTGEAYFDVTHNAERPFVIHTRFMDVKVLGTAFNIKAYGDEPADETSLIRGQVQVTLTGEKSGNTYILNPLEKIVVYKDPAAASQIMRDTASAPGALNVYIDSLRENPFLEGLAETAWTENRLVFDNETLKDAARKIEKWYGVQVVIESAALEDIRYTGTFDKQNLEKMLSVLQLSIPVMKYRIENGKVILF